MIASLRGVVTDARARATLLWTWSSMSPASATGSFVRRGRQPRPRSATRPASPSTPMSAKCHHLVRLRLARGAHRLRAAARCPRRRTGAGACDLEHPRTARARPGHSERQRRRPKARPGVGQKTAARLLLELQARFDYLGPDADCTTAFLPLTGRQRPPRRSERPSLSSAIHPKRSGRPYGPCRGREA